MNGSDRAAEGAAKQEAIQEEVRILLEKKAGESTFLRQMEGSNARAVLNGLAVLIVEYSRLINVEISKVLSLLAVSLLAPHMREGENREE